MITGRLHQLTVYKVAYNRVQDIVERFNRVIYLLADCSIKVTALLEYLDLALATPSWISCYSSMTLHLIPLNH